MISLRSLDVARRRISAVSKTTSTFQRHQLEHAYAAALGYESWGALKRDCSVNAPAFIHDQELSDSEQLLRHADQASRVKLALGILFPIASQMVGALAPTADFKRPVRQFVMSELSPWLQEDPDIWWAWSWHAGHPLVPREFYLGHATNLADLATYNKCRSDTGQSPEQEPRNLFVLIPPGARARHGFHNDLFFRRSDVMEIEPIFPAKYLQPDYHFSVKDFVRQGARPQTGITDKLRRDWQSQLSSVRKLKRIGEKICPSSDSRTGTLPLGAGERMLADLPWHWPLKPIISDKVQLEIWATWGANACLGTPEWDATCAKEKEQASRYHRDDIDVHNQVETPSSHQGRAT